jgi:hypothetical protein
MAQQEPGCTGRHDERPHERHSLQRTREALAGARWKCGDFVRWRRLSGPSKDSLRVGMNWGHGRAWSTPQTDSTCAENYTPSTIIQWTHVLHSNSGIRRLTTCSPNQYVTARSFQPGTAHTIELHRSTVPGTDLPRQSARLETGTRSRKRSRPSKNSTAQRPVLSASRARARKLRLSRSAPTVEPHAPVLQVACRSRF